MKKKKYLKFDVDTPALMKEICDCSLNEQNGVMGTCINILRMLLVEVAERAVELNDAKLNILMLRLNLYEVDYRERAKIIERLEKESEETK